MINPRNAGELYYGADPDDGPDGCSDCGGYTDSDEPHTRCWCGLVVTHGLDEDSDLAVWIDDVLWDSNFADVEELLLRYPTSTPQELKTMNNDSRIAFKLPTSLRERVAAHVEAHSLNLSAVVRKLLVDWLAKEQQAGKP